MPHTHATLSLIKKKMKRKVAYIKVAAGLEKFTNDPVVNARENLSRDVHRFRAI
jgi:hypothetical protein